MVTNWVLIERNILKVMPCSHSPALHAMELNTVGLCGGEKDPYNQGEKEAIRLAFTAD